MISSGSTRPIWRRRRASRTPSSATGRIVFLAGQTALDAVGRIVAGDVVAQFERALTQPARRPARGRWRAGHLASLTIYIVDMPGYRAQAREIGAVWRRLVGRDYPADAGIGVARLWDAEALVEVQGFAIDLIQRRGAVAVRRRPSRARAAPANRCGGRATAAPVGGQQPRPAAPGRGTAAAASR